MILLINKLIKPNNFVLFNATFSSEYRCYGLSSQLINFVFIILTAPILIIVCGSKVSRLRFQLIFLLIRFDKGKHLNLYAETEQIIKSLTYIKYI